MGAAGGGPAGAGRWTCCRRTTKKGCFMVACKYSGSCSLPLRDLSLLAARERMMREAGALLAGAGGGGPADAAAAP